MSEELILVNEENRAIGRAGKRDVHTAGLLHRAFSIFLFDVQGGRVLGFVLDRGSRPLPATRVN